MKKVVTEDGSLTYFSEEFDENYHSLVGAWTESHHKFVQPSGILENQSSVVLDLGFGLGYNSFALIRALKPGQQVFIFAFELYRATLEAACGVHDEKELQILSDLLATGKSEGEWGQILLFLGDARINMTQIKSESVDAVFLDPFSPPKNPQLWTVQFLRRVYASLKQEGVLLTYSSALPVIAALQWAGFQVGFTPAVGRKRGGVKASKSSRGPELALSEADHYFLRVSTNAVPNVDRGYWSGAEIASYRKKLGDWLKEKGFLYSHKQAQKLYRL